LVWPGVGSIQTKGAKTMSENSAVSTDDRFLCGFYMYPGNSAWQDFAGEHSNTGNRMTKADAWRYWIERLVDAGFNAFNIGVANDPKGTPTAENRRKKPYIKFFVELSEEYNFKIIPLLDSVYFKDDRELYKKDHREYIEFMKSQIEQDAPRAIECIKKYKDKRNVLSFSVAEEPTDCEFMHWLMAYYDAICEGLSDVKFDLIFKAARERLPLYLSDSPNLASGVPFPFTMGVDLYIFWWEFSGGCFLAAPSTKSSGAFGWYVRKLKILGRCARERNTHFKVVFTAASQEQVITEQVLDSYGTAKERIKQYAEMGEHGWLYPFEDQDAPWGLDANLLKYFRYYHPPRNCTRAMVWLAVMMGAKSIFQWALKPTPRDVRKLIRNNVPTELFEAMFDKEKEKKWYWRVHILGLDNEGTYMLDEYTEACQYLQRFGWLINNMEYDDKQDPSDWWNGEDWRNSSSGLEIIGWRDSSGQLETSGLGIYSKSFSLAGCAGEIVVLVNGNVGTWYKKKATLRLPPDKERYRIDKWGYVHEDDFTPYVEPLLIKVSLEQSSGEGLWDLESGKPLISASDETATLHVKPGGGKFLFIGSAREMTSIRRDCGLE
jgi:hypothetical protein